MVSPLTGKHRLRVLENEVLRRTYESERKEAAKD
jgi:hypothetical protein